MLLGKVTHDDAADGGNAHAQQYDTQHASRKDETRYLCPMLYVEGFVDHDEEEREGCRRGHHDGEATLREQVLGYELCEEIHLLFRFRGTKVRISLNSSISLYLKFARYDVIG